MKKILGSALLTMTVACGELQQVDGELKYMDSMELFDVSAIGNIFKGANPVGILGSISEDDAKFCTIFILANSNMMTDDNCVSGTKGKLVASFKKPGDEAPTVVTINSILRREANKDTGEAWAILKPDASNLADRFGYLPLMEELPNVNVMFNNVKGYAITVKSPSAPGEGAKLQLTPALLETQKIYVAAKNKNKSYCEQNLEQKCYVDNATLGDHRFSYHKQLLRRATLDIAMTIEPGAGGSPVLFNNQVISIVNYSKLTTNLSFRAKGSFVPSMIPKLGLSLIGQDKKKKK